MKILLERFPYRYVECAGHWKSMVCQTTVFKKRTVGLSVIRDMYLLDNQMQLLTAIEDFEYTKWLDPDRVPFVMLSGKSLNYPWSGRSPFSHGWTKQNW